MTLPTMQHEYGSLPLVALLLAALAAPACAQEREPEEPPAEAENGADAAVQNGADAISTAVATASCWIRDESDDPSDRPSPMDSTSVALDAGVVKVCYSSPRMRGREVMGALVPYDRPWRLGANEATSIHLSAPGTIADVPVDAGSYSLFAVPGPDTWELVINGWERRWGVPISRDVRTDDIGSSTLDIERTETSVEELTMTLSRAGSDRADLSIEWETTRVVVPVVLE